MSAARRRPAAKTTRRTPKATPIVLAVDKKSAAAMARQLRGTDGKGKELAIRDLLRRCRTIARADDGAAPFDETKAFTVVLEEVASSFALAVVAWGAVAPNVRGRYAFRNYGAIKSACADALARAASTAVLLAIAREEWLGGAIRPLARAKKHTKKR